VPRFSCDQYDRALLGPGDAELPQLPVQSLGLTPLRIVLDPPKFARSRAAVDDALRAYARLNRLALDVLAPGGILVTCSCSGHVTRDDFFFMLVSVAQQSGRDIQVLEQRGAATDHPVSVMRGVRAASGRLVIPKVKAV